MKTKEKILASALKIFNANGIRGTTARHIAADLGISPGNLHYHYKHTEDILIALFNQLVKDSDVIIVDYYNRSSTELLIGIDQLFIEIFQLMNTYKFFFLNFVEIGLWIPEISRSYAQLLNRRQKQFLKYYKELVEQGILRKNISEKSLTYLLKNIFIVSDFWLSQNILINGKQDDVDQEEFLRHLQAMIYPYLENQGTLG